MVLQRRHLLVTEKEVASPNVLHICHVMSGTDIGIVTPRRYYYMSFCNDDGDCRRQGRVFCLHACYAMPVLTTCMLRSQKKGEKDSNPSNGLPTSFLPRQLRCLRCAMRCPVLTRRMTVAAVAKDTATNLGSGMDHDDMKGAAHGEGGGKTCPFAAISALLDKPGGQHLFSPPALPFLTRRLF